jgi:hypothetical protein
MICDNCQRQNGCHFVPNTISGKELCGNFSGIKDSGNRTEFATGAVRDIHDGKIKTGRLFLPVVQCLVQ